MRYGIFDHMDQGARPLSEQYESRLRLIEAYDRGGFHAYHLAEHHATPLGMAPSPAVFLAAVAQRTKRLRFGPLVYILTLQSPLRANVVTVVEKWETLDSLKKHLQAPHMIAYRPKVKDFVVATVLQVLAPAN